jgi:hypothetical protein
MTLQVVLSRKCFHAPTTSKLLRLSMDTIDVTIEISCVGSCELARWPVAPVWTSVQLLMLSISSVSKQMCEW